MIYDPHDRRLRMAPAVRVPRQQDSGQPSGPDRAEAAELLSGAQFRGARQRRTTTSPRAAPSSTATTSTPKLNYTASSKQTIFAKYGRMWATSGGKAVFGVAGGSGLGGADPGHGRHHASRWPPSATPAPFPRTCCSTACSAYERQDQSVLPNDYGTNYGQQFGIPNTNGPDIRQSGFPNIAISGYNGFGVPNWMPVFRDRRELYAQRQPDLDQRRARGPLRLRPGAAPPESLAAGDRPGTARLSGLQRSGNGPERRRRRQTSSTPMRRFLLGLSDDAEKSLQYILATGREWQFGWYVRDRWQVNRNLTVILGLRYELYPADDPRRQGPGALRSQQRTTFIWAAAATCRTTRASP